MNPNKTNSSHVDTWILSRIQNTTTRIEPPSVDLRAAQYLRVSTPQQRRSLELQRQYVATFAQAKGLELVATYEDAGKSGVTLGARAGLSRLLLDIVSGRAAFAHLLIMDVSRWGRFQDFDEAAHYEFVCRANGVSVTYCRDLNADGPAGQLEKQVRRVMAGEYSRQLSERIRRGKRRSAEAGNAPGSWPRYTVCRQIVQADGEPGPRLRCGEFRTNPRQSLRLVPGDAERRAVVQRIFAMFGTGGKSMADIAAVLTADGLSWSDGSPWTKRRILRILRHPIVTGVQLYGRSRTMLGVRGLEGNESLWGEVTVFEPIIPIDVYNAAQNRFEALAGRFGYSNEEMIEGLRTLLREKGRLSAKLINACPHMPRARRYETRFGSLGAAWKLAGYAAPAVSRGEQEDGRPMDREAVLEGLRTLRFENGKVNTALITADRRLPSLCLIKKAFGSLSSAYREAGIA